MWQKSIGSTEVADQRLLLKFHRRIKENNFWPLSIQFSVNHMSNSNWKKKSLKMRVLHNKLATKIDRYTLQTQYNFRSTPCEVCRSRKSVIRELIDYTLFQGNYYYVLIQTKNRKTKLEGKDRQNFKVRLLCMTIYLVFIQHTKSD